MEDELELLGGTDYFDRLYDREAGRWRFAREGDFWEAVARAQAAGWEGEGARYAVIDGGFDLTVPELAERGSLMQGKSRQGGASHGTTVAMLILAVAPRLNLDLYCVLDERGKPNETLLRQAIELVRASDATVVNMSLGAPVKQGWLSQLFATTNIPSTCDLAATLLPGKLVVAAVGNKAGRTYCPAAHPGVVAIGFQREVREVVGDGGRENEVAAFAQPSYSQAAGANYTLVQPAGVLGSSFATPLVAASAALMRNYRDLLNYADANTLAGQAAELHRALTVGNLPEKRLGKIADLYYQALARIPHIHASGESFCFGCSAYAAGIHTNAGLFFGSTGEGELGRVLLQRAIDQNPWSPHAYANLAALYTMAVEQQLDSPGVAASSLVHGISQAVLLYAQALKRRPDFGIYQRALTKSEQLRGRVLTKIQPGP